LIYKEVIKKIDNLIINVPYQKKFRPYNLFSMEEKK